jgi:crotonobetainyl-CoA:carnitine CoA-transferase CaiB-like acyl-CoA transferase
MYAYSSIMAAVLQRQKTGKGCMIEVSMLESLVEWMGFPLYVSSPGRGVGCSEKTSPEDFFCPKPY